MEKLLKNKWLMLLLGAVVLYFVWRKFGGTIGCYLNPNCDPNPEQTGLNASGTHYGSIGAYWTDVSIRCDKIERKIAQGLELTVWEKEYWIKHCLNRPTKRKR